MITWDERKRRKVIRDHAVDFGKAGDIFDDPFAIDLADDIHGNLEERWSRIGNTAEYGLIIVIYTFRGDDIRFITARKAEKWMVRIYEKQKGQRRRDPR